MSRNYDTQPLHDIDNTISRIRGRLAPRTALAKQQLKSTLTHRSKISTHKHTQTKSQTRQLKKRHSSRSVKDRMEYVRSFRGKRRKH